MPAYVLSERLEVWDLGVVAEYRRITAPTVKMFGGIYRTVSFNNQVVEGAAGPIPDMIAIIEFPTRDAAERWYHSPEYAEAIAVRQQGWRNRVTIVDASPPLYAQQPASV
jgi:uncharacterized protein (DUF1330 family)